MLQTEREISVDLIQAAFVIASTTDILREKEKSHKQKVAYISYCCAQKMGWEAQLCQQAFVVGLIHDCGFSLKGKQEFLLAQNRSDLEQNDLMRGYLMLRECSPFAQLAEPVLYQKTDWKFLQKITTTSIYNKHMAALIHLATFIEKRITLEALDQYQNIKKSVKDRLIQQVLSYSGTKFHPQHTESIKSLFHSDGFWFSMESHFIEELSNTFSCEQWSHQLSGVSAAISVAELLLEIIAGKSDFTYTHSIKVAKLALYLGSKMGYSEENAQMLYLAGMIHDIGKIKTPEYVLHKPSKLDDEEFTCIKRHATDSHYLLGKMFRHRYLANWAANHHERLDGSGYPLGLTAKYLDEPSRIIAVVDVFQALTQHRPYRSGMSLPQVLEILKQSVYHKQLDGNVFSHLLQYADECFSISTA